MMIAAIDVDLTVVNSAYHWWKWLEDMTKAGLSYSQVCDKYDFTQCYKDIWLSKGIAGEPLDFWRQRDLYDNMVPVEGAVDGIGLLKESGYKIVFVSTLKGDHHKSKCLFLKKFFHVDAFIGTKEKWAVRADLVIDDRNKCLNMFPEDNIIKIKMNTTFDQDVDLTVDLDYSVNDWFELSDIIRTGGGG